MRIRTMFGLPESADLRQLEDKPANPGSERETKPVPRAWRNSRLFNPVILNLVYRSFYGQAIELTNDSYDLLLA